MERGTVGHNSMPGHSAQGDRAGCRASRQRASRTEATGAGGPEERQSCSISCRAQGQASAGTVAPLGMLEGVEPGLKTPRKQPSTFPHLQTLSTQRPSPRTSVLCTAANGHRLGPYFGNPFFPSPRARSQKSRGTGPGTLRALGEGLFQASSQCCWWQLLLKPLVHGHVTLQALHARCSLSVSLTRTLTELGAHPDRG